MSRQVSIPLALQTYPTCTDLPNDNVDGPVCRTGGTDNTSSIELGECVATGEPCISLAHYPTGSSKAVPSLPALAVSQFVNTTLLQVLASCPLSLQRKSVSPSNGMAETTQQGNACTYKINSLPLTCPSAVSRPMPTLASLACWETT